MSTTLKLSEKRRAPRLPHVSGACLVAENDQRQQVIALNMSSHGVGFASNRPLDPGSTYCMEVGSGSKQLLSQIRIVRMRSCDGVYEVGAEFC